MYGGRCDAAEAYGRKAGQARRGEWAAAARVRTDRGWLPHLTRQAVGGAVADVRQAHLRTTGNNFGPLRMGSAEGPARMDSAGLADATFAV